MKVYMLKHKPSGLFFKPGRFRYGGPRITLSKKGKVYFSTPSFRWVVGRQFSKETGVVQTETDHWEIVELEISGGING